MNITVKIEETSTKNMTYTIEVPEGINFEEFEKLANKNISNHDFLSHWLEGLGYDIKVSTGNNMKIIDTNIGWEDASLELEDIYEGEMIDE